MATTGNIINNPSYMFDPQGSRSVRGGTKSYLGTTYILNNKADFEPRKNL